MTTRAMWIARLAMASALAVFGISAAAGDSVQERKAASTLVVEAAKPPIAYDYTVLESGRPVSFSLPTVTSPTLYRGDWGYVVNVPINATRLQISVVPADPRVDVDLYVRYNEDVGLGAEGRGVVSDHHSANTSSSETVVVTPSSVPPLRAGKYYVALVLWTTEVPVNGTITATVEIGTPTPQPGPTPTPGPTPSPGPTPLPPNPVTADDFYNAVGGQRQGLAPGSIATVVAPVLAPGIQGCLVPAEELGPLPLILGEVSIEFSGRWAPILKVCNSGGEQSVTFQVPSELEAGSWPVVIRVKSVPYSVPAVNVSAVSPAIYLTRMSDGQRRALLLRPNGSYVSLENPAQRGETLRAFVVGLGPLTPPIGSNTRGGGQISDLSLRYSIIVGAHSTGAALVYARYAPNLIGIYEIGFRLPDEVPSGKNILFVVAAEVDGKLVFSDGTSIPVQ